ncbi:hypothetical protein SDC9_153295 [bioreactor metagenome]|uniref:Uncharacterized protein n=1 Tax=bioreactor metagenome TaxID=1076179 RepID=A0A645EVI4_9ZZZZ
MQSGSHIDRRGLAVPVRAHVRAKTREHQPQHIEQFGRGAEGAAHAGHARALPQRKRRGDVPHRIDRGTGGMRHAPAQVGREGLDVAARPFRIQHAHRQRGLARARYPRDGHQLLQGHVHVDVLQVVYPGAAYFDRHRSSCLVRGICMGFHGTVLSSSQHDSRLIASSATVIQKPMRKARPAHRAVSGQTTWPVDPACKSIRRPGNRLSISQCHSRMRRPPSSPHGPGRRERIRR